jgi:hypothetical protein
MNTANTLLIETSTPIQRVPLWKRVLITMVLIAQSVVFWPSNAYAVTPVPDASSSWAAQLLQGNRDIVNGNTASVMLNLPNHQTTGAMFDTFETKPVVFGRYFGADGTGLVQVMRLSKNPYSGAVNMVVDVITPEMAGSWFTNGNQVIQRYNGIDPFIPFRNSNGLWNNISSMEFHAIMGQIAQRYSTTRGYLAEAKLRGDFRRWDVCTTRVLGSCLRRTYFQELQTFVLPDWSVMHAAEMGRGNSYAAQYRVAGCGGSPQCVVNSGVAFTKVGQWSDMPKVDTLASTITQSQTGWTGVAFALAFAALAVLAGPAIFGTQGLFTAGITALSNGVAGSIGLAATYGIEALAYLALNQIGGNSPNEVKDNMFSSSDIGGANAPQGGSVYTPASGIDPSWDARPAVRSLWNSSLPSAPAGVGTVYNRVRPTNVQNRPTHSDNMRVTTPSRELNYWTAAQQ